MTVTIILIFMLVACATVTDIAAVIAVCDDRIFPEDT